jgi:hypothetical protein
VLGVLEPNAALNELNPAFPKGCDDARDIFVGAREGPVGTGTVIAASGSAMRSSSSKISRSMARRPLLFRSTRPPLLDRLELALGVLADPAHRGGDHLACPQKSDG